MDSDDVRERIMRCLALSRSSNEHEAMLAMVKARALMAKYHVEVSLDDADPRMTEVTEKVLDFPFTKADGWWISNLVSVIGKRYCCRLGLAHAPRGRTYRPCAFGRRCDVEVLGDVARTAIVFVKARIAEQGLDRDGALSYGNGFASGLNEAFGEQDESNPETALVMRVPEDVNTVYEGAVTGSVSNSRRSTDLDSFLRGREDGRSHLRKKLDGAPIPVGQEGIRMIEYCENCGRRRRDLSEVVSFSGDRFSVCRDCRHNFIGKRLDYYLAQREERA